MPTTITTTYLEILDLGAIVAARTPPAGVQLVRAGVASPELGRVFYTAVGGDWCWRDRLEQALRRAFALGKRVWVHTCTLDHPAALANYRARGLVPFRVERHEATLVNGPIGPSPGAARPPGSVP